jgi:hypothetical protein
MAISNPAKFLSHPVVQYIFPAGLLEGGTRLTMLGIIYKLCQIVWSQSDTLEIYWKNHLREGEGSKKWPVSLMNYWW